VKADQQRFGVRWKAVLDTNVLISALRFGGKPERVIQKALSAAFVPLTSDPLKEELTRVLKGKFLMAESLIEAACSPFWQMAEWIYPEATLDLCPDEPDNRVLECAIEGNADFIVTGDRHLLDLGPVGSCIVLKPDAFLTVLLQQEFKRAIPKQL